MIEVAHLKKKYGKKVILEDITFTVKSGECAAIIGKNGCGKSTLLKLLAGVMRADAGEIFYCGEKGLRKRTRLCGYVPQENPLLEQLSVKDNLYLWGGKRALQQSGLLEEFQLQELFDTPVENLSGGMKRRLSVVCALLNQPSILLLDEPTAALDFFYREQMLQWLKLYQKAKGTILIVTHEEQEILNADRCFFLERGSIRELSKEEVTLENIREMICEKHN